MWKFKVDKLALPAERNKVMRLVSSHRASPLCDDSRGILHELRPGRCDTLQLEKRKESEWHPVADNQLDFLSRNNLAENAEMNPHPTGFLRLIKA
jgi:hypothetical protein